MTTEEAALVLWAGFHADCGHSWEPVFRELCRGLPETEWLDALKIVRTRLKEHPEDDLREAVDYVLGDIGDLLTDEGEDALKRIVADPDVVFE